MKGLTFPRAQAVVGKKKAQGSHPLPLVWHAEYTVKIAHRRREDLPVPKKEIRLLFDEPNKLVTSVRRRFQKTT